MPRRRTWCRDEIRLLVRGSHRGLQWRPYAGAAMMGQGEGQVSLGQGRSPVLRSSVGSRPAAAVEATGGGSKLGRASPPQKGRVTVRSASRSACAAFLTGSCGLLLP